MTASAVFGFVVLPAVVFALLYFPAVTKLSHSLVSPYGKADVGRRLSAATVDGFLVMTIWFPYRSFESVLFVLAGAAYLLLRDSLGGRSVGKFFFGLVVISLDTGRPCTLAGSVRRNLVLLLPGANVVAVFLEAVTIKRDPFGQRLGDRMAQTQVVEGMGAKDFAAAFQRRWRSFMAELDGSPRRPRRRPA